MSARDWKDRWGTPEVGLALCLGLVAAAVIAVIFVLPPRGNTMREAPSAPEFAFARWITCAAAAAAAELPTQAMRVPRGVLVRTTDTRGGTADTVLVPIHGFREAERFLAALGCRLPGPPGAAEPGP